MKRFGNEALILSAKSVGGPFSSYRPKANVLLVSTPYYSYDDGE